MKGPTGLDVRPTGDRLKEALFNILGASVAGSVVLDVFGGTGAIGIEALSRGAREVTFVENTRSGERLIRENLELCGVRGGYRILQQDVFAALRALARERFQAGIVFFDPPYDWKPYGDLLDLTFDRELLAAPFQVVVEHHRKSQVPEAGAGYRRVRLVRQGDHCLSFFAQGRESAR